MYDKSQLKYTPWKNKKRKYIWRVILTLRLTRFKSQNPSVKNLPMVAIGLDVVSTAVERLSWFDRSRDYVSS